MSTWLSNVRSILGRLQFVHYERCNLHILMCLPRSLEKQRITIAPSLTLSIISTQVAYSAMQSYSVLTLTIGVLCNSLLKLYTFISGHEKSNFVKPLST
jgi:hypothetical protein